ncbi:hypothetical protein O181_038746 [Austropuccinia psidii MF-1]|uniref:Uncharacterized protein n=1 Tax=Austropuccinia psidii MF-1 TaxID=1389203 RepID=A0A9Q3HBX0_9BASI|nr:hypothetical protein [Austropuccinia psidii MF-1]
MVRTDISLQEKKRKKFFLDINLITNDKILRNLLEDLLEEKYRRQLTSKMELNLVEILRKHRESFSLGDETLGNTEGHDIEQYLDVERPYPPILRKPPYPERLETMK